MYNFYRSIVNSVAGLAAEDFNELVKSRAGGKEHVSFYEGGFSDAVKATTSPDAVGGGHGLLLIWLYEQEDRPTIELCMRVWTHPGIVQELKSRFSGWAGDVFRFEASSVARALRVQTFPALACIQRVPRGTPGSLEWPRGCYFRVFWRYTGFINGEELHHRLRETANRLDEARQRQNAFRQQMQQMEEMSRSMLQGLATAQAEMEQRAARNRELSCTEAEERPCVEALYESIHGSEAPPIFDGTFAEALASARSAKRLLLVWLYSDSPTNAALCSEVLSGEVFRAFVAEYFILWPGDAERWLEPVQLRELLKFPGLPSLLVLQPLSVFEAEIVPWGDPAQGTPTEFPAGSAWSLLGGWDATTAGTAEDAIVTFLAEHGDRAKEEERLREEERQRNLESAAEARALRELQEQEYEESLRIDRERNQKAQESLEPSKSGAKSGGYAKASEQPPKAKALEQPPKAKTESVPDEKHAALVAKRVAAAKDLLADTKPIVGEQCTLVLRLPNGRRAERKFGADDKLAAVLAWADCCGELSVLEGGDGFEVPPKFALVTTYPRAFLRETSQTLRNLQLLPNAVLAMVPEDE